MERPIVVEDDAVRQLRMRQTHGVNIGDQTLATFLHVDLFGVTGPRHHATCRYPGEVERLSVRGGRYFGAIIGAEPEAELDDIVFHGSCLAG